MDAPLGFDLWLALWVFLSLLLWCCPVRRRALALLSTHDGDFCPAPSALGLLWFPLGKTGSVVGCFLFALVVVGGAAVVGIPQREAGLLQESLCGALCAMLPS